MPQKKYTDEEWQRLLALGEIKDSDLEAYEKRQAHLRSLMRPDVYNPAPSVLKKPQPIEDYASEVTIKRADGTIETQPAYTLNQVDKIIKSRAPRFSNDKE